MERHVFLWTVCWSSTKRTSLYFNQWKQIKLTKEKSNRHRRRMDTEKQNQARKNRTKQTTIFSGLRVTQSLVLCVCFVDRCLSFCPFPFGHCIVCPPSDSKYPFGIFKPFFNHIFSTISVYLYYYISCQLVYPTLYNNKKSLKIPKGNQMP